MLVLVKSNIDEAYERTGELFSKYKEREQSRGGVFIKRSPLTGGLIHPLKQGRIEELTGIYHGYGDLLSKYTVDATGFDSRLFMRMWREDIEEGSAIVIDGLENGEDGVFRRALGSNPSNRDIVLFTIAGLIRTRSKRRSKNDILGGWWNVLTGKSKRLFEFGKGANICSTEAIVAKLLIQLYGMNGVIKQTYINLRKPNQPHNYLQVDDYPNDENGPIIDISGAPHLWGFIKDKNSYSDVVLEGRAWLSERRRRKESSLTDFDRRFIDFSLRRFLY